MSVFEDSSLTCTHSHDLDKRCLLFLTAEGPTRDLERVLLHFEDLTVTAH
jgi:hypothetical protein